MESQRTNSTGPVDITNTQSAARNKTMSETESKVSCPMSKLEQILKDGKDTSPPDATPEPDTEEVNAGNRIKHTFVNEGIQKRAILTLPEVLLLKTSTKRDAEKSIHTVQALAKGTRFGPYEGEIKEKGVVSRFCWEIFRDGKVLHYVDGEDDSKATWMKFVRFASSNEQSNLMAYQHSEQIYFETIHDVPANTELLLQPWSTLSNDPPTPRTEDSSGMKKTSDKVSELNKSLSSSSDKIKELLLDHNENEKITKKDLALSKLHCLTCGKKFQDKHKLRRHQITHTNEKPFACGKCGKRFRRSDTVQTHIKKCHKDPEKWIPVSTKAVPDGKGTKNKSILRKLFQKSGSSHQGTLKCPICDKQISACNFSRHIKVHTRPYKCELCHKRFSRPADGKRHLLKFHKTQDWKKLKYIIDNKNINVIGDKSKDKSEIEHKENSTSSDDGSSGKINDENGTGNGSFECTPGEVDSDVTMSKCFSQPASPSSPSTDGKDSSKLESMSSDDSQASADLSVSKQSITLLTNSGSMFSQVMDDPSRQEFIPMDVSPSSTSNQSSKIIDLTCSTCSKVFSSTSKLNRHKLIHSGLKPHVCEICGRGFSRSEYIKDHKLRMHRNEGDDQEVDPDDIIDISTIFTAFLGDSNDDIKTNLMTISPMTTEVCQLESVYDGGIYIKEGYSNSAGEDSPMMDDENDACNLKEDHTSSEFHHDSSDRNDDSFPVQNEEGLSNQDHITGNNLYFAAAGISQDIDDVKAAEVPAVSYSCKVCARKLDSLLKLRLHMTAHNRSYFCKPCGRKFPQLHSFLSHKLTKAHQDQVNIVRKKNVIAKCQEDKINESLLDDRGTTSLPADQAFSSCHLQESGLTSTQENKCSQCGKGFADPGQLQTHECVPTGNGKLYQCTECGKSFTQSGNLKTHRSRVHARNRDPCPVCGKCFSCLKNHMKVHTGEKPYECIVCGRAFSQSGNLRVHERRQHQLVKY